MCSPKALNGKALNLACDCHIVWVTLLPGYSDFLLSRADFGLGRIDSPLSRIDFDFSHADFSLGRIDFSFSRADFGLGRIDSPYGHTFH